MRRFQPTDPTDPEVVPGWWAFHCCHLDLDELTAESLAELRDDTEWAATFACYPTRNEALAVIAGMWDISGYPQEAAEVRGMIT